MALSVIEVAFLAKLPTDIVEPSAAVVPYSMVTVAVCPVPVAGAADAVITMVENVVAFGISASFVMEAVVPAAADEGDMYQFCDPVPLVLEPKICTAP